jgi:hypothetical protein
VRAAACHTQLSACQSRDLATGGRRLGQLGIFQNLNENLPAAGPARPGPGPPGPPGPVGREPRALLSFRSRVQRYSLTYLRRLFASRVAAI